MGVRPVHTGDGRRRRNLIDIHGVCIQCVEDPVVDFHLLFLPYRSGWAHDGQLDRLAFGIFRFVAFCDNLAGASLCSGGFCNGAELEIIIAAIMRVPQPAVDVGHDLQAVRLDDGQLAHKIGLGRIVMRIVRVKGNLMPVVHMHADRHFRKIRLRFEELLHPLRGLFDIAIEPERHFEQPFGNVIALRRLNAGEPVRAGMHPAAVDQRRVIPVAVKELPDVHVEAVGRLVDAARRYERLRPAHAVMAIGQQHFVAGQRILKAAVEAAPLLRVVQGEIGHAHADGGIGAHCRAFLCMP